MFHREKRNFKFAFLCVSKHVIIHSYSICIHYVHISIHVNAQRQMCCYRQSAVHCMIW